MMEYYDGPVDDDWITIMHGPWKKVFIFKPVFCNRRIHCFRYMYRAPDYIQGGYIHKTPKQFIIDELKGKN